MIVCLTLHTHTLSTLIVRAASRAEGSAFAPRATPTCSAGLLLLNAVLFGFNWCGWCVMAV